MKIKKSIIIFFVILFALFLPSIVFLVSNLSFLEGNFITAGKINKYLEKFFDDDLLNMKNGDYYYRFGDYEKALKEYNKIRCTKQKFCQKLFHNVGNTLYYLGEKKSDLEKIDYWQRSVDSYLKSLSIKEDKETLHNYEYVKSKLDELMKKMQEEKEKKEQEQKEQNEKNNDSGKKDSEKKDDSGENGNEQKDSSDKDGKGQEKDEKGNNSGENSQENKEGSGSNNNEQNNQNTSSGNVIPKGESRGLGGTQDDVGQPLSEDEKSRIDDYIKGLMQQEKENMKLNVPQKDFGDIFNDMDDSYDW